MIPRRQTLAVHISQNKVLRRQTNEGGHVTKSKQKREILFVLFPRVKDANTTLRISDAMASKKATVVIH